MGVSWGEMLLTPRWVIDQDMEFMSLEDEYSQAPKKKESK